MSVGTPTFMFFFLFASVVLPTEVGGAPIPLGRDWPLSRMPASENESFKSAVTASAARILGTRMVYVSKADDRGFPLLFSRVDGRSSQSATMDEVFGSMRCDESSNKDSSDVTTSRPSSKTDELVQVFKADLEKFLRGAVNTVWSRIVKEVPLLGKIARATGLVDPNDPSDAWLVWSYPTTIGSFIGVFAIGIIATIIAVILGLRVSGLALDRNLAGNVVISITIRGDSKTARVLSCFVSCLLKCRSSTAARSAPSNEVEASTPTTFSPTNPFLQMMNTPAASTTAAQQITQHFYPPVTVVGGIALPVSGCASPMGDLSCASPAVNMSEQKMAESTSLPVSESTWL